MLMNVFVYLENLQVHHSSRDVSLGLTSWRCPCLSISSLVLLYTSTDMPNPYASFRLNDDIHTHTK